MAKTIAEILGTLKPATPSQQVDWDHLPEERGSFTPPPYPGDYTYQLPPKMDGLFEVMAGDAEHDQAIVLIFDDDNPLTIVQAQAGNEEFLGQNVRVRVNSIPRGRGKEKIPVADTTYLARVLDPQARPNGPAELVPFFAKQGGKRFISALSWNTNCSDKRQITVMSSNEDGSLKFDKITAEDGSPTMGCGARYYLSQWPKENGRYTERLTCSCGATLSPFPQLERFRVAPQVAAGSAATG